MQKLRSRLLLLALAGLLLPIVANADEGRLPVVNDSEKLRHPGAPQISPAGDRVAFSVEDSIYVVSGDGNGPRRVTADIDSARDPRWSADGRHLYFVSDRGDADQVWKLPVERFGEAVELTQFEHGVSATRLSPDETRVLLTFNDDELEDDRHEAGPPEPFVLDRRQFKMDRNDGYLTADKTRHIYVLDIGKNTLRQLTSGPFPSRDPVWSHDGESIVFVSNRQDDFDGSYRTDVWTVPAEGGEPVQLTSSESAKFSPAFSPDGRHIAYMDGGDGVYSVQDLVLIPATGGEPRVLTAALDRWVSAFEFSEDGRWIYFSYDNAGGTELGRVRVSDARIERLIEGDINVGSFDVGPGATLAVNLNGRADTTNVHLLENNRLTKLTDLNREYFDEILVGDKRKVSFKSTDDTTVQAFITTPPDYTPGTRYPAILKIHGGPVGQFSWGYDFGTQFLATNGYIVIEPNPRGSTGFGEDYIRAIYRTWGITDYDDIIAAVDFAVAEGLADPDRLAVTGYSYGGYMTNVVVTETNRFKAAASGAGHSLIEANFGHDIYQQWYVWELGTPWEERERYDKLSPFLRVGNVETPTLFLGGRIDWNVPILNAELMYQALKVRGVDTRLVVYPDSHHGGWHEKYEQDYLTRVVNWFDQYVKD